MIHGQFARRLKTAVAASAIAALLGGCISASAGPNGTYATPIGNAPVTANPTPYSAALYCMADYARRYNLPSPRMAVGRIADYTGTVSADGGRQVTGGASRIALTAQANSGARIGERLHTTVTRNVISNR
ncbi:MAG: transcriptional regulator, partial [Brevundimonas sp.]|nr:transcriptional regulator [Brevundimonas sp.]